MTHRRVLGWRETAIPQSDRPADILLGRPDPGRREDNQGGLSAATIRWPHAVAGDERTLYIADAGDNRVLGWTPAPADHTDPAQLALGQESGTVADEFKHRPQGGHRMRFPYSVVCDDQRLMVADTSNNRVLVWRGLPRSGAAVPADTVLAQPDMDANGENRWSAVTVDSMCWPYGLSLARDILAVADSGNNRVMFWNVD